MGYSGGQVVIRRSRGEVNAEVRRGRKGQLIMKTSNPFMIPLVILEALILALLMALFYCFRFDPIIRYNVDMVNYTRVLITCDPETLTYSFSRPYFDYTYSETKSLEGLELQYDLPEWVFFLCAILVPIIIFCSVEGFRALLPGKKIKEVEAFGYVIPQYVRRIFRIIGGFLIGGCLTGIFVSLFKLNIISPRPHFMSVCFNNTKMFPKSCNSTTSFWSPEQDCTSSVEPMDILEATKSFPSFHAAVALFCGTYTSAYVALAARIRGFSVGGLLVLLGLGVMTMIGATHRLGAGHSFPRDIIIGAVIGLIFALFTIKVTLNKFQERKWKLKILDPIPHNEDKMLPVLSQNLNLSPPPKADSIASKSSDSDEFNDSDKVDSDDDYDKIIAKIQSNNMIPRAAVNVGNPPNQAVNKNVTSAYRNESMNKKGSTNTNSLPYKRESIPRNSSHEVNNSQESFFPTNQLGPSHPYKTEHKMNNGYFPSKPQRPFSYTNPGFENESKF